MKIELLCPRTLKIKHSSPTKALLSGAMGDRIIREQFDLVDEDGDLLVTFEEFRAVQEAMGVKEEDSRKIMTFGDADEDGMLNLEEFAAIYENPRHMRRRRCGS